MVLAGIGLIAFDRFVDRLYCAIDRLFLWHALLNALEFLFQVRVLIQMMPNGAIAQFSPIENVTDASSLAMFAERSSGAMPWRVQGEPQD